MPEPSNGKDGAEGHLLNADIAGERGNRRSQSTHEQPHQEERQEQGKRGSNPIRIA